MTSKIMKTVFQNMTRTVCRRDKKTGEQRGAAVVTVRASTEQAARLREAWPPLSKLEKLLRAELWQSAEPAGLEPSAEEKIRGRDNKIAACFMAEFADTDDARQAMASIARVLKTEGATGPSIGSYRLICTLEHSDIAP